MGTLACLSASCERMPASGPRETELPPAGDSLLASAPPQPCPFLGTWGRPGPKQWPGLPPAQLPVSWCWPAGVGVPWAVLLPPALEGGTGGPWVPGGPDCRRVRGGWRAGVAITLGWRQDAGPGVWSGGQVQAPPLASAEGLRGAGRWWGPAAPGRTAHLWLVACAGGLTPAAPLKAWLPHL